MVKRFAVLLVVILSGCDATTGRDDVADVRLRAAVAETFVFWRPAQPAPVGADSGSVQPGDRSQDATGSGKSAASHKRGVFPAPTARGRRWRLFRRPIFKRGRRK